MKVAKFYMENETCIKAFEYISAVFEFISSDEPIKIILNRKGFKVEEVHLPTLDPYMDTLPDSYLKKIPKYKPKLKPSVKHNKKNA